MRGESEWLKNITRSVLERWAGGFDENEYQHNLTRNETIGVLLFSPVKIRVPGLRKKVAMANPVIVQIPQNPDVKLTENTLNTWEKLEFLPYVGQQNTIRFNDYLSEKEYVINLWGRLNFEPLFNDCLDDEKALAQSFYHYYYAEPGYAKKAANRRISRVLFRLLRSLKSGHDDRQFTSGLYAVNDIFTKADLFDSKIVGYYNEKGESLPIYAPRNLSAVELSVWLCFWPASKSGKRKRKARASVQAAKRSRPKSTY